MVYSDAWTYLHDGLNSLRYINVNLPESSAVSAMLSRRCHFRYKVRCPGLDGCRDCIIVDEASFIQRGRFSPLVFLPSSQRTVFLITGLVQHTSTSERAPSGINIRIQYVKYEYEAGTSS